MTKPIKKVALIGGGVIGGGWAARFLLNGIDVNVFDRLKPRSELCTKCSQMPKGVC